MRSRPTMATSIRQHIPGRIPTLDGWRGIAILMVVATHFQQGYLHHVAWQLHWLSPGEHGVNIFFVLSGYLITDNLLRAEKIDLGNFYLRRFFRLMPAAWAYLLFLCFMTLFTPFKLIGNDIWSCLFFFRNYAGQSDANTCTTHFWSLSLEEQFYLLWAPLLCFAGRKWAAIFASIAAIAIAGFRFYHWSAYLRPDASWHSEVRGDALFVGCLLAFALQSPHVRRIFQRYRNLILPLALAVLAFDIVHFQVLVPLHESLATAVAIACTALNPDSWSGKVLEWPHLKYIGLMSYSIYLWQNLFLRSNWGAFGIPLLVLAAFISWLCIERPLIVQGRKVSERWARRRAAEVSPPPSLSLP